MVGILTFMSMIKNVSVELIMKKVITLKPRSNVRLVHAQLKRFEIVIYRNSIIQANIDKEQTTPFVRAINYILKYQQL